MISDAGEQVGVPPPGNWRTWLLLAGRGFGKTRSGAEAVRAKVTAGWKRIALVGPPPQMSAT